MFVISKIIAFGLFFAASVSTSASAKQAQGALQIQAQTITGRVTNVNKEARALTLEQIDPATGRLRSVYLASVMDEDLLDAEGFEDIKVGQTLSVRAGMSQQVSTAAAAEVPQQVTKIKQKVREDEGLLEDVGTVRHSNLSID